MTTPSAGNAPGVETSPAAVLYAAKVAPKWERLLEGVRRLRDQPHVAHPLEAELETARQRELQLAEMVAAAEEKEHGAVTGGQSRPLRSPHTLSTPTFGGDRISPVGGGGAGRGTESAAGNVAMGGVSADAAWSVQREEQAAGLVRRLWEENCSLREQVERAGSTREQLEAQVAHLDKRTLDYSLFEEEYSARVDHMSHEVNVLKSIEGALEDEVVRLQRSNLDLKARAVAAETAQEEAAARADELEAKLAKMMAVVAQAVAHERDQLAEEDALHEEIHAHLDEEAHLAAALSKQAEYVDALVASRVAVREQHAALQAAYDALAEDHAEVVEERDLLVQDVADAAKDKAGVTDRLLAVTQQYQRVAQKLAQATATIEDTQAQLVARDARLADQARQMEEDQATWASLRSAWEASQRTMEQSFTDEATEWADERARLVSDSANMSAVVERERQRHHEYESENARLARQVADLQEAQTVLEHQLTQRDHDVSAVLTQKQSLQKGLTYQYFRRLKSALRDSQRRRDQLEAANAALTTSLADTDTVRRRMESELIAAQDKAAQLERRVIALQGELNDAQHAANSRIDPHVHAQLQKRFDETCAFLKQHVDASPLP